MSLSPPPSSSKPPSLRVVCHPPLLAEGLVAGLQPSSFLPPISLALSPRLLLPLPPLLPPFLLPQWLLWGGWKDGGCLERWHLPPLLGPMISPSSQAPFSPPWSVTCPPFPISLSFPFFPPFVTPPYPLFLSSSPLRFLWACLVSFSLL